MRGRAEERRRRTRRELIGTAHLDPLCSAALASAPSRRAAASLPDQAVRTSPQERAPVDKTRPPSRVTLSLALQPRTPSGEWGKPPGLLGVLLQVDWTARVPDRGGEGGGRPSCVSLLTADRRDRVAHRVAESQTALQALSPSLEDRADLARRRSPHLPRSSSPSDPTHSLDPTSRSLTPPMSSPTTTMNDPAQAQSDPAPPDDPDHPFAAQLPPPLPDYPVPPALPHLAEPPSNSLLFDLEATAPVTHRPPKDDPRVSLRAPPPPPPPPPPSPALLPALEPHHRRPRPGTGHPHRVPRQRGPGQAPVAPALPLRLAPRTLSALLPRRGIVGTPRRADAAAATCAARRAVDARAALRPRPPQLHARAVAQVRRVGRRLGRARRRPARLVDGAAGRLARPRAPAPGRTRRRALEGVRAVRRRQGARAVARLCRPRPRRRHAPARGRGARGVQARRHRGQGAGDRRLCARRRPQRRRLHLVRRVARLPPPLAAAHLDEGGLALLAGAPSRSPVDESAHAGRRWCVPSLSPSLSTSPSCPCRRRTR